MKFKRYAGHNGKRKKIARLYAHLQQLAENRAEYEVLCKTSGKIYDIIGAMPGDDIVWKKQFYEVNLLMTDVLWQIERRDALGLTY